MHPFQIELDPLFADVPVHPVPPHPRARTLRRIHEAALQGISCRSEGDAVGAWVCAREAPIEASAVRQRSYREVSRPSPEP